MAIHQSEARSQAQRDAGDVVSKNVSNERANPRYAVIYRRLSNGSLNEDDGVHPPQEDTDEREIPGTE
ncbi:hypothetical protein, partial [Cupriavidus numazuensis]|uniref:hypothetical protein n=1 Tax=Cupriavidus numazuensis TaxID=221992 RepID=UPI001BA900FA